jgi:hypothetical protein
VTSRDITPTAILPCRGGLCTPEKPSRHRFTRFSERYAGDLVASVDTMYRCDLCGHERIWGTLDPVAFRSSLVH